MVKNILTVVLGLAGIIAVYAFVVPYLNNPDGSGVPIGGDDAIACTMDAMMCPDGSYVGRIPPVCEFAPCPSEVMPGTPRPQNPGTMEPVFCPADAKICPDGSGVGRVGPNCEFAACPGE